MHSAPLGPRVLGASRRAADAVLALVLLVATAPLCLAVAAAIAATPGPVLMRRHCIGRRWREFTLLGFRTRAFDAEQDPAGGRRGLRALPPPRLTEVGAFLVRWRLDRLPALVNVLRGEMSLFGPRPVSVAQLRALPRDEQRRRYAIAPGCFAAGAAVPLSASDRSGPAVGF